MFLATDLDGTFLGGDAASRTALYRLITRDADFQLAFVTGRGLESVLPILSDPTIPTPDYIICDVGATVVTGEDLHPVQPLQAHIDARWPGEQAVADAFAHFTRLERQEIPQQRRCSYFCGIDAVTPTVRRRARELDCDLIHSADRYLDVLPAGVNKGSTLRALVKHLDIPANEVLVAGDTLNDEAMMRVGYKAVCVGGSEPALLAATNSEVEVHHAKAPGCGGILEALQHFRMIDRKRAAASEYPQAGHARLVMVYHRLPYDEVRVQGKVERRRPASPNGIIPTLLSFFSGGQAGSWIAWSIHQPKDGPFEAVTPIQPRRYPNLVAARVALTKRDVDIFYRTFSKEAFWPLLHTFWERATFNEDHWQVYLRVNEAFARRTAEEAAKGATVWIHDYNLWMVPAYLRSLRPDLKIAFFHHTHFPSADIFNIMPWRHEIIGSLLHCDYIGFHIPRQVENFVDAVRCATPLKVLARVHCAPRFMTYGCAVGLDEMTTRIQADGRVVGLGAHPVGVDVKNIAGILKEPATQTLIQQLRSEFKGRRVILSLERLDYTKGTLAKLLAFERLLTEHPELHAQITLAVVCVPASAEMTIYRTLRTQIDQAVGRINGRFSRLDWTPIRFFFRSLPFSAVVAHYAVADVMWITPLRDGLNLVAKEYVAVRGIEESAGVLVLSEFAGVAAELKSALLTNPHDVNDLYEKILRALTLPTAEATARMRTLFDIVSHHDLRRWGREFLAAVRSDSPEKAVVSEVQPAAAPSKAG
ncbi:MAG: glucosylglycerol-phosphate synthase [Nevskiaceae bacterium]|nr:MAG: glucosylglycerol-phosphate synthase [Nevskiaceae bacterium]TBR73096.1 MAG: glucosylglycerol-phosphate synthase [Nevskiaceae bacterium]